MHNLPEGRQTAGFSRVARPQVSPGWGICAECALRGGKTGLSERPSRPGEAGRVPTRELGDGDTLAGRLNEPAVSEVDPHVVHLARLGRRAAGTEEEDVRRLELRERDALRPRHLAAHLVRRAPAEHARELSFAGVLLQLVDAPHEAGAVEAAVRLDAERRFLVL